MDVPNIHMCSMLQIENEMVKKKIKNLKKQNALLEKELQEMKEKQKMETMLKQYVTSRDVYVQTEARKASSTQVKKNEVLQTLEQEKTNKLMSMYNNLMKRYEKELKNNMEHVETIASLNINISEVEQKLRESEKKVRQQERELKGLPRKKSSRSVKKYDSDSSDDSDSISLASELKKVKKERDKIKSDLKRMKNEIDGLDHGFFDEIEDIKYALQQSAKLNKEYEKSLRKICKQFGVPYPHPERKVFGSTS